MNSTLLSVLKYLAYGVVVAVSQLAQAHGLLDKSIADALVGMVISLLGIHVYGAVQSHIAQVSTLSNVGQIYTTLQKEVKSNIPSGWLDNGVKLTAPNGKIVISKLREYVLNNNWNFLDVPLNDQVDELVEEYNPLHTSVGQSQTFLYTKLGYVNDLGSYKIPVGQELLGNKTERSYLKAQVEYLRSSLSYVQKSLLDANSTITMLQQKLFDLQKAQATVQVANDQVQNVVNQLSTTTAVQSVTPTIVHNALGESETLQ